MHWKAEVEKPPESHLSTATASTCKLKRSLLGVKLQIVALCIKYVLLHTYIYIYVGISVSLPRSQVSGSYTYDLPYLLSMEARSKYLYTVPSLVKDFSNCANGLAPVIEYVPL